MVQLYICIMSDAISITRFLFYMFSFLLPHRRPRCTMLNFVIAATTTTRIFPFNQQRRRIKIKNSGFTEKTTSPSSFVRTQRERKSTTSHEAGQIRLHNPKQNENILGRRARFHYTTTHNFWLSNRFTFAATWLSSRIIASSVGSFQLQAKRACRLSIIVESRKVVFFSVLIITRLCSLIRLVFDSHISLLSFSVVCITPDYYCYF